jgi:predicted DCC family thiol-disulfide oxidoreductase YuxK
VNPRAPEDTLTVLHDGSCPLCRREIAHVQGLAQRQGDAALCFVDISREAEGDSIPAAERAALLARFHVQRADGTRLHGAAAFVAMWQRLPGWRWLASLARLPGMLPLLERAYGGFLRLRPGLQALARRWEPTPGLSLHLERELRADHAGETGTVCIYRGIAAVAAWRGVAMPSCWRLRGATARPEASTCGSSSSGCRRRAAAGCSAPVGWPVGSPARYRRWPGRARRTPPLVR